MSLGNFEEVDDYKYEGDIMEMKNELILPIYENLKAIVRRLKKTEVNELYDEFLISQTRIKKRIVY